MTTPIEAKDLPVAFYGLEIAFLDVRSDRPSKQVILDCKISGRDPSRLCAQRVIFAVGSSDDWCTWDEVMPLHPGHLNTIGRCLRIWGISKIELPASDVNTAQGLAWMLAVAQENGWRYNFEVSAYAIYTDGTPVSVLRMKPTVTFSDDHDRRPNSRTQE